MTGLFIKNEHDVPDLLAAIDASGSTFVHFYAVHPGAIVEVLNQRKNLKALYSPFWGETGVHMGTRDEWTIQAWPRIVGASTNPGYNFQPGDYAKDTLEDKFSPSIGFGLWYEQGKVKNDLQPLIQASPDVRRRIWVIAYESPKVDVSPIAYNRDHMRFDRELVMRLAEMGLQTCVGLWDIHEDARISMMESEGVLEALEQHNGMIGYKTFTFNANVTALSDKLFEAGFANIPMIGAWFGHPTSPPATYLALLNTVQENLLELLPQHRNICLYGYKLNSEAALYELSSIPMEDIKTIIHQADPAPEPEPEGTITLPNDFSFTYDTVIAGEVVSVTKHYVSASGDTQEVIRLRAENAMLWETLNEIEAVIERRKQTLAVRSGL